VARGGIGNPNQPAPPGKPAGLSLFLTKRRWSVIRGGSGYVAAQFELVTAAAGGLFAGKALFCIDGEPGIWRKVADPKVSDPSDRGIIVANFGGGKIFLMFDAAVSAELEEAGVRWLAEVSPEISAAITKAKELAASQSATLLTAAGEESPAEAAAPAPRKRGRPSRAAPLPSMTGREGSVVAPVVAELEARTVNAPPTAPTGTDPGHTTEAAKSPAGASAGETGFVDPADLDI